MPPQSDPKPACSTKLKKASRTSHRIPMKEDPIGIPRMMQPSLLSKPQGLVPIVPTRVTSMLLAISTPNKGVVTQEDVGHAGGCGRGGTSGRGSGIYSNTIQGRHVTVSNPIIAAIDRPSTDIWTPVEISKARKAKNNSHVTAYICADSGASRDLFTQREWFVDYTDILSRNEYVVVADDTRVPIHGIGTVRFRLGGREILLRRVYHVPGLNGSLLSIRTHRQRGPGCSFLADSNGCHLTFPSFFIDIDDTSDVLITCEASQGGHLEYEQPPSRTTQLSHARNKAIASHTTCRRSRIPVETPTLQQPEPISSKNNLDELIHAVLPTHYVPESSSTSTLKQSSAELHRLFGCRKLDYSTPPSVGMDFMSLPTGNPLSPLATL